MLRTCFVLACLFFCFDVTAQSSYVDSLQRIVGESRSDTTAVDALIELGREFIYISKDKSLQFTEDALRMATILNYDRGIAAAYRNLGAIYSASGYYFVSLIYVNKALAIFKAKNDLLGEGNCYVTIANTYRRLKAFEKAIEYHQSANRIFYSLNNAERIAITTHNLGQTYLDKGEITKAEELASNSQKKLDSLNLKVSLTSALRLNGDIALQKGDLSKAEELFNKAVAISDELKDLSQKDATLRSLIGLAKIYHTQRNSKAEARSIIKAMSIAKESQNLDDVRELYRMVSDYHIRAQDHKSAYQFLSSYLIYADSIEKERPKEVLSLMNSLLSTLEIEVSFEKLKRDQFEQQRKLEVRNTQVLYGTISLVILLVATILLIVYVRDKRNANKELKELDEAKNKFFSIVAHDLKAPLNSLLSFSTLISKHANVLTSDEIKEIGERLKTSVGNSLKMTENLMMWARSQMNDFEWRPADVNLKPVVHDIFLIFQPIAMQKKIQLNYTVPDDVSVFGDSDQVTFILRNLVNNAIKFTPVNGSVDLNAHQNENQVIIEVKDTGVGIPKAQMEMLFDLDSKVSTIGTAGETGTGLGLRLCKEFVEKNNGSISVITEVGRGTTFTVRLPKGQNG